MYHFDGQINKVGLLNLLTCRRKLHDKEKNTPHEIDTDAIRLATMPGANIAQVSRSLSISDGSLCVWIRQSRE